MANLASNPWSFTSADPATATITSATGLTLNADGTVTITTTGALTFNTTAEGGASPLGFTVIGASAAAYNGFYNLIIGTSGGTSFTMKPQFSIPAGTAQSGGGTLIQCLYRSMVRIEDMSWQGLASATSGSLDIRDRNGNIIWQSALSTISGGAVGYQNRGKVFWVEGISPNVIATNTVLLMTIN